MYGRFFLFIFSRHQVFFFFFFFFFKKMSFPDPVLEAVNVVQQHFDIIEKEVIEIDKDILMLDECVRKYGDVFLPPLSHLQSLRQSKKATLTEIANRLRVY
eukprot:TRINITY_DN5391_c0_g1_i2.p1 TRINITY_DN5391_c0_g1~~TRINITY_DN5391_c0_g1_i2.p1  ORF type:complete len:101 (+),score=1.61 TRINITY_DN5391_c0_g1_i2:537-839(+)